MKDKSGETNFLLSWQHTEDKAEYRVRTCFGKHVKIKVNFVVSSVQDMYRIATLELSNQRSQIHGVKIQHSKLEIISRDIESGLVCLSACYWQYFKDIKLQFSSAMEILFTSIPRGAELPVKWFSIVRR